MRVLGRKGVSVIEELWADVWKNVSSCALEKEIYVRIAKRDSTFLLSDSEMIITSEIQRFVRFRFKAYDSRCESPLLKKSVLEESKVIDIRVNGERLLWKDAK